MDNGEPVLKDSWNNGHSVLKNSWDNGHPVLKETLVRILRLKSPASSAAGS